MRTGFPFISFLPLLTNISAADLISVVRNYKERSEIIWKTERSAVLIYHTLSVHCSCNI